MGPQVILVKLTAADEAVVKQLAAFVGGADGLRIEIAATRIAVHEIGIVAHRVLVSGFGEDVGQHFAVRSQAKQMADIRIKQAVELGQRGRQGIGLQYGVVNAGDGAIPLLGFYSHRHPAERPDLGV